jgi:alanine racemase
VVKADAYGHGVAAVAPAIAPISDALCVATLDEAVALRPLVKCPVVLLYPAPADAAPEAVDLGVELSVMSVPDLQAIRAAARDVASPVRVHLGVETGMGRGGVPPQDVAALAAEAEADPGVELAGLWSHLHSPEDPLATDTQRQRLEAATRALREAGIPVPRRHLAASGGIFASAAPHLELVRPGLAIYGLLDEELPIAPGALEAARRLRPAMSLHARAAAFSHVPEGGTVGYGGTWRADRPSRIAVLPLGYGDGYLRGAQPGASVLVRGRRVPLVGRVSMDSVTADVTDLPGLDHADDFVLMGTQGGDSISAGELGRRRNTIAWEVLAAMAQRLARVYHPQAGTAGAV